MAQDIEKTSDLFPAEQVLLHPAEMVHHPAGASGVGHLSQSLSGGAWCLRTAGYHGS